VTAAKLAVGSVLTANILDSQVITASINDAAITTAKINDGAVTAAKIAVGAILTATISNAQVTTIKLADDAVTTVKILDGSITAAKMAVNSILTATIQDGQVTTAKLADLNVTTAKIAAGAVTAAKMAVDSILTATIADAQVTAAKVATANNDGLAAVPSIRTLGTGAQQAAAGNHTHAQMARIATGTYSGNGGSSQTVAMGLAAAMVFIVEVTDGTHGVMAMLIAGNTMAAYTTGASPVIAPDNSVGISGTNLVAGLAANLNTTGKTYHWVAIA
jgi:hypothetical protein